MGRKKVIFGSLIAIVAIIYGFGKKKARPSLEDPIVEVSTGKLQGTTMFSRDGRIFYEFLKIPYAKPPVGDLRFEPPQDPDRWDGIRDATEYGERCIQLDLLSKLERGDEDCLFLNVFTSKLNPSRSSKDLLPVLFFIHGGIFAFGSSNTYRPEFIMDEDVVLVTINYRLASLGFLNTGDGVVRGNMGLKDQVQALKWVQKNIQAFGGDPKKVTIFGESAGGASVHYHMLSPMSEGLFYRAISQSGVASELWALMKTPEVQAKRFAASLNCTSESTQNMIRCLKSLPASEIVQSHRETGSLLRNPITVFVPTVEKDIPDGQTFLPRRPQEIIKSGKAYRVPWITGVNSEEGLLQTALFMKNETLQKLASSQFEDIVHASLYLEEKDPLIIREIQKFYNLEGQAFIEDIIGIVPNITNMFSDRFFYYDLHHHVKDQSKYSPVYLYYYTYSGDFSLLKFILALRGDFHPAIELLMHFAQSWISKNILGVEATSYGVCHSDELGLQFKMPYLSDVPQDHKDYEMSKHLNKLWVAFARGDEKLQLFGKTWHPQPAKEDPLYYFRIDITPETIQEPFTERILFWKNLLSNKPSK